MPNPETKNPEAFVLADEKFQEYVRSHHKFTIDTLAGESETPHLLVVTRNMDTLKDELILYCLACPGRSLQFGQPSPDTHGDTCLALNQDKGDAQKKVGKTV